MFDTIVVGAGIAGVTAARLLQQSGRRVVILEARDRVGGRLWTDRTDGIPIDRGASWIHGLNRNPLTPLVQALGMDTIEFTVGAFQVGGRPIANFDAQRHHLSEDATARLDSHAATFEAQLERCISTSAVGETYAQAVERTLDELRWTGERRQAFSGYHRHRTEEQCGADSGLVAAHALDDDAPDGDEVIFPRGYDVLATRLADGLDVRLRHEVISIDWAIDGVRVSTAKETFAAADVVVTVPLGVLKEGSITFKPALPDDVSGAIGRVGMGTFNKVYLQFPKRFWEQDVYAIRQWGAASFPWHSWYDVSAVSETPMLVTFAGGAWGQRIESMLDEEIVSSVLGALGSMYGDRVPQPTGYWITRWASDQHARGSYSYVAANATKEDHDLMAGPVGGVLHLAGEATYSDDPATVHGALLSGHRAAERILGRSISLGALTEGVARSNATRR